MAWLPFQKCNLNWINKAITSKLDLTGKHQHGFKRNKSTATGGALFQ